MQYNPGEHDMLEHARTVLGDGGQPRLGDPIEQHTDCLSIRPDSHTTFYLRIPPSASLR